MKSILKKLTDIQCELKAPKNQFNKFGNYSYRNREDILEGLKPLLLKHQCTLIESDSVVCIGSRYYVEATAKLFCIETGENVEVKSLAREEETKKGMDGSQITGSSSSYARKYALNGLFAIDDVKDPDSMKPDLEPDNKKLLPPPVQPTKPVETITLEWTNTINGIDSVQRANDVLQIIQAEGVNNATKTLYNTFCKNKGYSFDKTTMQWN